MAIPLVYGAACVVVLLSRSDSLAQSDLGRAKHYDRSGSQSRATGPTQVLATPRAQFGESPFGSGTRQNEKLPVALSGFDVVPLHDQQAWQRGHESLAAPFDGQKYLFSSERHRAIFLAAPERYAPVLGGDCVVTFAETGQRVAGEAKYGLLYQDRLYFVAGATQLRQFQEDSEKYRSADLAMDGVCPVTYRDAHRQQQGIPATPGIFHGLRYLFAGAVEREKFLNHPGRYTHAKPDPKHEPQQTLVDKSIPRSARSPALTKLDSDQSPEGSSARDRKDIETTVQPTVPASARKPPNQADVEMGQDATMEGYCPVSISESGIWVLGLKNFRVVYDNKLYLFAGQKQKEMFLKSPEQFVPALGGGCVVSKQYLGKTVPGSIYHAAVYDKRLFLFTGADQKQAFKSQPEIYKNIDLALSGQCVVSHQEDKQPVDGKAEFEARYGDLRYRFASAEYKQKFLAAPVQYAVKKQE